MPRRRLALPSLAAASLCGPVAARLEAQASDAAPCEAGADAGAHRSRTPSSRRSRGAWRPPWCR